MLDLLVLLLERLGILIIVILLLSRMHLFRKMVHNEHGLKEKLMLIVVFSLFGLISNYSGIEIREGFVASVEWHMSIEDNGALANTRVLGVALGGMLGGPLVGFGAGIAAGLHRMSLGGFTAVACGISTILAGLLAGWAGRWIHKNSARTPWFAALISMLLEGMQMGIILLAARPFDEALKLVGVIAVPMIMINGFGALLFMVIIQSILREENRTRALQTHNAFAIADETLPFFRKGLNIESCRKAAEVILSWTNADAISITDNHQVLAHAGAGTDHHIPKQGISTQLTRKVLESGKITTAHSREEIQCEQEACPLQAAIVIPLVVRGKTAGTLKMYFTKPSRMDMVQQELAEGLSKLFSTQLELAEAELQSRLLRDAEIKALQAQVHPHFLFNAINTISILCRRDPLKARELLLSLGVFFRSNLQGARSMLIPLEKELEHVEAYIQLEQARYPERYQIVLNVDPELSDMLIPPFTLQPLVENAVHYAFSNLQEGESGLITLTAQRIGRHLLLSVSDDGKGIAAERLSMLGEHTVDSNEGTGTALYNISKRIKEIYNGEATFYIESELNQGTKVVITLPVQERSGGAQYVEGVHRG